MKTTSFNVIFLNKFRPSLDGLDTFMSVVNRHELCLTKVVEV